MFSMFYKCLNHLEEKKNMHTGMISPLDFQNLRLFINKTSQFYLKIHEIHVKGERKSKVQPPSSLGVCPSSP